MTPSPYSQVIIESLHDHKSRYQRNMLVGLLIALIMALAAATALVIGNPPRGEPVVGGLLLTDPVRSISASDGDPIGRGDHSGFSLKMILPYEHDGFRGLNGYRILRDNGIPVCGYKINNETTGLEIEPDGDFAVVVFESTTEWDPTNDHSFSNDFGLPDDESSLIDLANNIFPPPGWGYNEIVIPGTDEPAFIKMTVRPRASSNYWIKGIVVIEFIIRKNGNVTDRVLIYEDPEGYGAADSLFEALNEALYWPARIAGRKVDTKVTLTWKYCVGSDCNGYTNGVSYSDQLIIRDDSPRENRM